MAQSLQEKEKFIAQQLVENYQKKEAGALRDVKEQKSAYQLMMEITDANAANQVLNVLIQEADQALLKLIEEAKRNVSDVNPKNLKQYLRIIHEALYQCLAFCEQFQKIEEKGRFIKEKVKMPGVDKILLAKAHALFIRVDYIAVQVFKDERFLGYAVKHGKFIGVNCDALSPMDNYFVAKAILASLEKLPSYRKNEPLPGHVQEIVHRHLNAAMDPKKSISDIDKYYAKLAKQELGKLFFDNPEYYSFTEEEYLQKKYKKPFAETLCNQRLAELINKIKEAKETAKKNNSEKTASILQTALDNLADKGSYYDIDGLVDESVAFMSSARDAVAKDISLVSKERPKNEKLLANIEKIFNDLGQISSEFALFKDISEAIYVVTKEIEEIKKESTEAKGKGKNPAALTRKEKNLQEILLEKKGDEKNSAANLMLKRQKIIAKFHQENELRMREIDRDIRDIIEEVSSSLKAIQKEDRIPLEKFNKQLLQSRAGIADSCLTMSSIDMLLDNPAEFYQKLEKVRDATVKLKTLKSVVYAYMKKESLKNLNDQQKDFLHKLIKIYGKIREQFYWWDKFSSEQLVALLNKKSDGAPAEQQEIYLEHIGRVSRLMSIHHDLEYQWELVRDDLSEVNKDYSIYAGLDIERSFRKTIEAGLLKLGFDLADLSPETFGGCDTVLGEITALQGLLEAEITSTTRMGVNLIAQHLIKLKTSLDALKKRVERVTDIWKDPEFLPKSTPEKCQKLAESLLTECGRKHVSIREIMLHNIKDPRAATEALAGLVEIADKELNRLVGEAKCDLSEVSPEQLQRYLETTHEILYQCCVVSQQFQVKDGKLISAIDPKVLNRVHAVFARAYHIAGKVFEDEQFFQHAFEHQKQMSLASVCSPMDNYLLAQRILDNANRHPRELTRGEKEVVHRHLNAAIKPAKQGSTVDAYYAKHAEVNLKILLAGQLLSTKGYGITPEEKKAEKFSQMSSIISEAIHLADEEGNIFIKTMLEEAQKNLDERYYYYHVDEVDKAVEDLVDWAITIVSKKPEVKMAHTEEDRRIKRVLTELGLSGSSEVDCEESPQEKLLEKLKQIQVLVSRPKEKEKKEEKEKNFLKFYRDNQARMEEVYEHIRHVCARAKFLPEVKTCAAGENLEKDADRVKYDVIVQKMLIHRKKIPDVFFTSSPAEFLRVNVEKFPSKLKKIKEAAEALRKLSESIEASIHEWEEAWGAPTENEKAFIKQLKSLNRKVRECVYCWEKFTGGYLSPFEEKRARPEKSPERSNARLLHIQQLDRLMNIYHDLEDQYVKIDEWLDEIESFFAKREDNFTSSYKQENFAYEVVKASLRKLYGEIGKLSPEKEGNCKEVLDHIDRLSQQIDGYITKHTPLIGVNEFCGYLERTKMVLVGLKKKVEIAQAMKIQVVSAPAVAREPEPVVSLGSSAPESVPVPADIVVEPEQPSLLQGELLFSEEESEEPEEVKIEGTLGGLKEAICEQDENEREKKICAVFKKGGAPLVQQYLEGLEKRLSPALNREAKDMSKRYQTFIEGKSLQVLQLLIGQIKVGNIQLESRELNRLAFLNAWVKRYEFSKTPSDDKAEKGVVALLRRLDPDHLEPFDNYKIAQFLDERDREKALIYFKAVADHGDPAEKFVQRAKGILKKNKDEVAERKESSGALQNGKAADVFKIPVTGSLQHPGKAIGSGGAQPAMFNQNKAAVAAQSAGKAAVKDSASVNAMASCGQS